MTVIPRINALKTIGCKVPAYYSVPLTYGDNTVCGTNRDLPLNLLLYKSPRFGDSSRAHPAQESMEWQRTKLAHRRHLCYHLT